MLDTRLTDDTSLRCDALYDRVAATPIGHNTHALRTSLAECDALEHGVDTPTLVYKLRDLRHWLRLAYGTTLHSYPPAALRSILLDTIDKFGEAVRAKATAVGA